MLEDYADKHGYTNIMHFTDDGYSGGSFERPAWKKLIEYIEPPVRSGADSAAAYYFSILLERSNRRHLAMCSREGGMDIETLAKERPEAL